MAKKMISVTVKTAGESAVKSSVDVLAIGVYSDVKKLSPIAGCIDEKLGRAITNIKKIGDFKADAKTTAILYGNKNTPKRILLVGLGEKKKLDTDAMRQASAVAARKVVELKAKTAVFALLEGVTVKNIASFSQAVAEGVHLGAYKYDEFISDKDKRLAAVSVLAIGAVSADIARGTKIAKAQAIARTLANRPGNVVFPERIAADARSLARTTPNLTCTVYNEKQLRDKKFGGIIAVGQGSKRPPRMIVLKYTPPKVKAKTPVVGLVGKGITFDSGGISLKPGAGMQDMKFDMGGAAAMLGAIKAIADLKLPVKVTAVICAAENMLSAGSYRPGDIITTYSGKTVEIQNTDAEGRMVLCDGIHYAKQLKCDVIIDAATLTGACAVALGNYMAGVMSNDDKLSDALQKAAKISGEKIWPLPCGGEYTEEMKSEIADLKNTGSRWGGASTAASFLREFAGEDVKWAHLDIAGPGMYDPNTGSKSGSTGFGVRLLAEYVKSLAK